jgi:hypothetical protein
MPPRHRHRCRHIRNAQRIFDMGFKQRIASRMGGVSRSAVAAVRATGTFCAGILGRARKGCWNQQATSVIVSRGPAVPRSGAASGRTPPPAPEAVMAPLFAQDHRLADAFDLREIRRLKAAS